MDPQESGELDGRTNPPVEVDAEDMKKMLKIMRDRLRILEENTETGVCPNCSSDAVTSSGDSQDGEQQRTFDSGTESSLELDMNLYYAAKAGHVDDIRVALSSGADINAAVFYGFSPLLIAVWKERVDAALYLLERGADPDARNAWTKESGLHYAVEDGNAVLVSVLLRHGACADVRNGMGRTPLHEAVSRGHEDCVSLLLEAGADPSEADDYGKKPTDICKSNFIYEMLRAKQCEYLLEVQ